jgi:hypothetical protein
MDTRIAVTQFDASGAVLQSATCFVSAAPDSPFFTRDLQAQLRGMMIAQAASAEINVGRDHPVLICDLRKEGG